MLQCHRLARCDTYVRSYKSATLFPSRLTRHPPGDGKGDIVGRSACSVEPEAPPGKPVTSKTGSPLCRHGLGPGMQLESSDAVINICKHMALIGNRNSPRRGVAPQVLAGTGVREKKISCPTAFFQRRGGPGPSGYLPPPDRTMRRNEPPSARWMDAAPNRFHRRVRFLSVRAAWIDDVAPVDCRESANACVCACNIAALTPSWLRPARLRRVARRSGVTYLRRTYLQLPENSGFSTSLISAIRLPETHTSQKTSSLGRPGAIDVMLP